MIKKLILFILLFVSGIYAANVNVNKNIFKPNENITVNFSAMSAKNQDWVAIYPKDSSTEWENVLQWEWTGDITAGTLNFNALPIGDYVVRAFYNNSYNIEASKEFSVKQDVVNPPSITTNKDNYLINEDIVVDFSNMSAKNQDWIAIYPKGSSTAWANVIKWEWTNDIEAGTLNFHTLPVGDYVIRSFYNNSYNIEASKEFSVKENAGNPASITTTKDSYFTNEDIIVNFANMSEKNEDWIGIYLKGSATTWENVIKWEWTNDTEVGTLNFNTLPVGDYVVKSFYNNSYNIEASKEFTVKALPVTTLEIANNNYKSYELIYINFSNFRGVENDWIGIFPVGAANQKESALEWRDTKNLVTGELTFNGLPAGTYEARGYFGNTLKKKLTFTIQAQALETIMYEDAESGVMDPRWVQYAGKYPMKVLNVGAQGSNHSIRTRGYWENGDNPAGFYFNIGTPAKKMKFLDLDMRIGLSSHVFNFGVTIQTKNGRRRILWASWMNHPGNDFSGLPPEKWRKPFHFADGYVLMNPAPTDFYLDTRGGQFVHYKINIEKTLRILEPDNELLGVKLFTCSGGDYDNLSLKNK